MNSASEDLFEIVHAIVLFEGLEVLRRPDERHFAELPCALAAEARHLLAGADAAADRRLLRGGIEGGRGELFGGFEREKTHLYPPFLSVELRHGAGRQ